MKLVLMRRPVWCRETYSLDISVSDVHIYRDNVTWWWDCKDEVALQLISELFPPDSGMTSEEEDSDLEGYGSEGKGSLKVKLEETSKDRVYTLIMKPHSRKRDNILKRLRDRFYDKVKITVSLGKTGGPQASTEEMKISSGNYKCEGTIDLNLLPEEKYHAKEFGIPMKIVAHINLSDEDILKSSPVSMPKKIFGDLAFTDVTITAKDGAQVEAHKCFLSAASSVLRVTFCSGLDDSNAGTGTMLDMSDISFKGVKAFLHYIYCRNLEEVTVTKEDPEIVYELLYAAHKYKVFPLEAWAIGQLLDTKEEEFTVELAFAIYAFVRKMETAAELKKKTGRILMRNFRELETLNQYWQLLEEDPESVKELHGNVCDMPRKKMRLSR